MQGNAISSPVLEAAKELIVPHGKNPQVDGANTFALLENSEDNANFVCSHYSVWMPLFT